MAADFRANLNDAQNVSGRIEFENAMLVPLTQVKMLAVEAEIGTGKLRARDPIFSESARRIVAAKITIIVPTFADGETKRPVRCHRRPRNAGCFSLFEHCPRLRINCINSTQIARTHPQRARMPRERLRRCRRRRKSSSFFDRWKL